jgi:hypothetical protein
MFISATNTEIFEVNRGPAFLKRTIVHLFGHLAKQEEALHRPTYLKLIRLRIGTEHYV